MSYGMDAKLGIAFQSSYGLGAVVAVGSYNWLQPISDTISLKQAEIVRKGMRAIYDEGDYRPGVVTVGGDILMEVDGISVGTFLTAVMARTDSASGTVFTHTFKPRTTDHNPLSAEQPFTYHKYMGDGGSAQLYSDLCGEQLDLVIANGALATAKLTVVGGTYGQLATLAPAYLTNAPIDWSVASTSIAGVARVNMESLTFSFKNNLTAKQTIGDGNHFPNRIKRGGARVVSVSGTLLFDNQIDLQNFISQTQQRLVVNMVGALNISSGYNEALTIDVPSFLFTDFPQGIPSAGELSVSFKGAGAYNVGSACSCTLTLVNSKAAY